MPRRRRSSLSTLAGTALRDIPFSPLMLSPTMSVIMRHSARRRIGVEAERRTGLIGIERSVLHGLDILVEFLCLGRLGFHPRRLTVTRAEQGRGDRQAQQP